MPAQRKDGGFEIQIATEKRACIKVIVHRAPFRCISYRAIDAETGEIMTTGITDMPTTLREREAFIQQVKEEVDFTVLGLEYIGDEIPF